MSIYSSGVDAYRSTAKWLTSLVPIATIVSGGVAFGPELIATIREDGLSGLRDDHWPAMIGAGVAVLGLVIVVGNAAWLLAKKAPDVTGLDDAALEEAIGAGVLAPFFLDPDSFDDAQRRVTAWTDSQRTDYTPPPCTEVPPEPPETLMKAVGASAESLRQWALHREISGGFLGFGLRYALGAALVVAGLITAAIDLDTEAVSRRDPPIAVTAALSDDHWESLATTLGCTIEIDGERPDIVLWFVAGGWDTPILQIDGPGCKPGEDWVGPEGLAIRPFGPATGSSGG